MSAHSDLLDLKTKTRDLLKAVNRCLQDGDYMKLAIAMEKYHQQPLVARYRLPVEGPEE